MTSPSSNIVVLSSGLLSAYGLDPQTLAKEINGWDNVAGTRLVRKWTLEQIGEIAPNHRLFLVGRGEPVPGLDARWVPVDLAVHMPWLGGDPKENVKALVWAALAEVGLEPDLERVPVEPYSQVLVMGQGMAAKDTVFRLSQAGVKVVWAVPNGASGRVEVTAPPGVQILPCLGLSGLTGFAGRLTASLDMEGGVKKVQAGAVLLCPEQAREPLGGAALSSPQTITMSAFEAETGKDSQPAWAAEDGFRLVFLAGLGRTSSSENMRRMMTRASEAAEETKATVYILASQVKVAEAGLERLYGRAREAGVVFIRTPDKGPQILIDQSGRVRLKFFDSLAQADLSLTPDRLVVEEALRPEKGLEPLAAKLGLTLGPDGYLGPDNVLFLSASTNRRGVLALGPVRGTDSAGRLSAEIDAAVAEVQRFLTPVEVESGRVAVTPGLCAGCLTCVRVCPHQAILFTNRPWPDPLACEACGLCV
ncbi:MAG: 4Fe-4S binding protein, partial [Thermodesulfobacteriota bacterium]|nr:4Fe-4S binding protein [Thermodesulfobacteriota bacterium]